MNVMSTEERNDLRDWERILDGQYLKDLRKLCKSYGLTVRGRSCQVYHAALMDWKRQQLEKPQDEEIIEGLEDDEQESVEGENEDGEENPDIEVARGVTNMTKTTLDELREKADEAYSDFRNAVSQKARKGFYDVYLDADQAYRDAKRRAENPARMTDQQARTLLERVRKNGEQHHNGASIAYDRTSRKYSILAQSGRASLYTAAQAREWLKQ